MRFIICGGRDYNDKDFLFRALDYLHKNVGIDYLIQGEANGADSLAKQWAIERNIPYSNEFMANWRAFGKSAGPMRNNDMIVYGKPDGVVAFPRANGDIGNGTADMVRQAREAGLSIWFPCDCQDLM